ncbi:ATR [Cordylochernes scorpioides]|uniref:ATR n=1 Tax=Cordylochernes scorpioides TaxID=51811 RepID=A0ABY6LR35_9ARAC|nr:ATR [Cordylochernes scorpioides]
MSKIKFRHSNTDKRIFDEFAQTGKGSYIDMKLQRILEAMSSAKITYSIKGGPRKSKPWFDKDCYDMKKLAKESLKKYRKTNRLEDRECYASSRKKYLALLDLKRKGFDNEKQEILRNAKDSKTFWKTIALYKSTSIIQGEISIQDWLNF